MLNSSDEHPINYPEYAAGDEMKDEEEEDVPKIKWEDIEEEYDEEVCACVCVCVCRDFCGIFRLVLIRVAHKRTSKHQYTYAQTQKCTNEQTNTERKSRSQVGHAQFFLPVPR